MLQSLLLHNHFNASKCDRFVEISNNTVEKNHRKFKKAIKITTMSYHFWNWIITQLLIPKNILPYKLYLSTEKFTKYKKYKQKW